MSKTIQETEEQQPLVHNNDYYRYIFKKTEKIVCAVFYTLAHTHQGQTPLIAIKDTEATAQRLLESVLLSLRVHEGSGTEDIQEVGYRCIELESKLRILHATNFLPNELLALFVGELNSVIRALQGYSSVGVRNPLFLIDEVGTLAPAKSIRVRDKSPNTVRVEQRAPQVPQPLGEGRRERILTILRTKGQSSIKDISDLIKDCSEKTIQRELNALISDNMIVREGERRWSKYSLV